MKERCIAGDGCLNGGQCQDIKNEHGRVTKIICSCDSPYEGIRCEHVNPEKQLALLLASSSRPIWITVLFTIIFLAFIVAAFLISYRYVDVISKTTKTVLAMIEQRLVNIPPPTMPTIAPIITSMKTRLASTIAARSPRSSSVLRTEFTNPLFDDRSSNGSSPEEAQAQAPTDATAMTYHNPLFVEETHAAPFSGIQVTYTNKFAP
ncbi:EGF-like domain protein [Ancylostoma caninum]|uniref:EGF-like domain protein n=1 Tax=Ancylostoma caninum TaxID=29170 RepID=A0A368F189_ANCCA|nr:EGF-like domain protein [Ancylostoma caninum]